MGWFADFVFGKAKNVEGPKPLEHSAWGVEREDVPNITEQSVPHTVQEEEPPEVRIIRVEPHLSSANDHVELWLCIENSSKAEVEVTHIECFRQTAEPARFLRPGENHEVRVYNGPVFVNDNQQKAIVRYKSLASGEYYQAEFLVKYRYSQHGGAEQWMPYEFDPTDAFRTT